MNVGNLKKLIQDLDDDVKIVITCLGDTFYSDMEVVETEFTHNLLKLKGDNY